MGLARFLATSKLFTPLRRRFGHFIIQGILSTKGVIIYFSDKVTAQYAQKVVLLVRKVKKESNMLLSESEGFQIFQTVKQTEKIKGDIAEVGVYKGGSAKLIAEAKGSKHLWLFDTFEGLQDVTAGLDKEVFHNGLFKFPEEVVRKRLESYKDVHIVKGYFPQSAKPIMNKKFSLVHLDVDTYESTKGCLKFFYPRMSKGGVIISHDYINAAGVRKAFDEFFKDKPEPVIEMLTSQCFVVKV